MSYLGSITTFRLFATIAGACAVIYLFFQTFYIRPKRHQDRKRREAAGEGEEEDIGDERSRNDSANKDTEVGEGDIDTKNQLQDTNMSASILHETNGLTDCPDGGVSGSVSGVGTPVPGSSLSHGPGSLLSINGGPRSLTGGTRV
eukprot:TRINITY_DN6465_c0_g1_i1.p1 TRINITY_DN6465_c0_g1~~TRINITY_DN6465_c0_g1_i1.p1  ORF type:complete len:145 (-),score=23.05 TRINITY_DN6465_c0_g1_i1:10-444(-)